METTTLPPLPYAEDALQPALSARTLSIHHDKHLAAYVDNLRKLLPGTAWESSRVEDIICHAQSGAILNNAGQVYNHVRYFEQFERTPAQREPGGMLREAIDRAFGGMEALRETLEREGASLFGSGWVWLCASKEGALHVAQYANAGCPLRDGLAALLTYDVWEHAYYLDYQNRRADYLSALWPVIDWRVVETRYATLTGQA